MATTSIDKAKSIGPSNPEVHRVSATVSMYAGNNVNANDEYLNAIDMKPDWAPYRYFYGEFLLKPYMITMGQWNNSIKAWH